MAADLKLLVPEFRQAIEQLLQRCEARGCTMRPYMGIRTPLEQAKLWRQSRSIEQIRAKIKEFRQADAHFLADCLEKAGPQNGRHVTNAPPGLSWHHWGEAVDSFWLVDSEAEWSATKKVNGLNGYRVYAEEAEELGLTAGGLWTNFKDWPHVQLQAAPSPLSVKGSLAKIDAELAALFATDA